MVKCSEKTLSKQFFSRHVHSIAHCLSVCAMRTSCGKTLYVLASHIREVRNTFWRDLAKQGFQFIFFSSEKAFIVITISATTSLDINCVQFSDYMMSTQ